jgi:hypothetical protein
MKPIELALALLAASWGGYMGAGFGVAAGASCRATDAVMPDAIALWFYLFVPISIALAIPRVTRWAALGLFGAYLITLGLGYCAGCQWGNFVGWHPD